MTEQPYLPHHQHRDLHHSLLQHSKPTLHSPNQPYALVGNLRPNQTFHNPHSNRNWLGLGLQGGSETVTVDGQEILIGGDVIVGINNQTVRKLNDLAVYIERSPGDQVTLPIIRNGLQHLIDLELGERPPPT